MIRYALYLESTGEIIGSGAAGALSDVYLYANQSAVASDVANVGTHYVDTGTLSVVEYSTAAKLAYANRPHGNFAWSPPTGTWIDNRTLVEVRSAVLERLKITRDSRINGGFVWDGSTFDSDTQISQPRLLGLFTTATAGGIPAEGYPWRLKDNSWRVLSAADAQGVWGAFQGWMASHFAAFAAHEATVLAETDIDVLRSYDTEADWP